MSLRPAFSLRSPRARSRTSPVPALVAGAVLALASPRVEAQCAPFGQGPIPAPGAVTSLDFGDLDGDGLPELVNTNLAGPPRVNVFTNSSATSSTCSYTWPVAATISAVRPLDAIVADFGIGSALADIAYVEALTTTVNLVPSAVYPAFGVPIPLLTAPLPIQVLARDFDADGDQDLAVLCEGLVSATLTLWRQFAPGAFTSDAPMILGPAAPFGPKPLRFAAGSFNGDGRPDLVITFDSPSQAMVVMNTSTPVLLSFVNGGIFPTPDQPQGVTTGDFDGDGREEFATANAGADSVSVFLHPGGPPWQNSVAFAGPTNFALTPGTAPWALDRADLDCDGDQDLVLVGNADGMAWQLCNDGSGSFPGPYASLWSGVQPRDVAVVDVDQDCRIEFGTASYISYLMVYCNQREEGKCCHHLIGGIYDAFSNATPPNEHSCPRAAVASWFTANGYALRPFDGPNTNTSGAPFFPFAHSFEDLPPHITTARLRVCVAPAPGNVTDLFRLDFHNGNQGFSWQVRLSSLAPGGTGCFELDLAALPGGLDLLPKLNRAHYLDVMIASDTKVDLIELDLETCCPDSFPTVCYEHDPLIGNTIADFRVSCAPPNSIAVLILSFGIGCNQVLPLPGFCLDFPDVMLAFFVNGAGDGVLPILIPPTGSLPPCFVAHTQIATLDPASTNLQWSCTSSAQVY
jgi:hypothetical protein